MSVAGILAYQEGVERLKIVFVLAAMERICSFDIVRIHFSIVGDLLYGCCLFNRKSILLLIKLLFYYFHITYIHAGRMNPEAWVV